MGFIPGINLSSAFKGIGSALGGIAKTAIQAVAPKVTDMLKGVVGDLFSQGTKALQGVVSGLPGPFGAIASSLVGAGGNALSNLAQGGLEKLIQSIVGQPSERPVAGAPAGTTVTPPALAPTAAGAPSRASTAAEATANVTSAANTATGGAFGSASSSGGGLPIPSEPDINSFGDLSKPENLFKAQTAMQKYSQMMQLLTSLQQMQHETAKSVIQNIRA